MEDPITQNMDLIFLQRDDEFYRNIFNYKLKQELPDEPKKAKQVVAEAEQYELSEHGVLLHLYTPRTKGIPKDQKLITQVCVPFILRDDVLKSYHDSLAGGMHQGFERTYAALRQKYYWPTMFRGLPTTKDKYKYVLLVVDSYSKWCEAFPLRTQEATEVAAILFKEVICRYGAPNVLVSDRGQQFLSQLVKALCELFQITRFYTSSYRPLLNGSVERMNSVILQSLRLYCKGQQDDWPELLPSIMMAYRMTPATQSTQHSPFFLLFGREMRLPIDTALTPKHSFCFFQDSSFPDSA
ncbi:protein NYNRIN-like [Mercenaria mercenaria]|uniref:protein NYNRIN-like n=1 Tax=Mercenaria mercenaria TaxID=6596 RepID=UPI00234EED07|nr:protein NYNRIN-like [Mercenaria mercenaria]